MAAIPVLVVATAILVFQTGGGSADSTASGTAPSPAEGAPLAALASTSSAGTAAQEADNASLPAGPAPSDGTATTEPAMPDGSLFGVGGPAAAGIASGALPVGAPIAPTGRGTWHTVPGRTKPHGTGSRAYTYTVEVEDGMQSVKQDKAFAAAVDVTLADPRSWIGGGQVTLARVDSGEPDFRVSLTSQMTIRSPDLCGWDVPLEASCFNRGAGRVLINQARWVRGAIAYGTDVQSYRTYAVNHEVGHALGFRHEPCPKSGDPAPIMMQQSWSTADNDLHQLDPQTIPADGKVCAANPYPYPGAQTAASSDPAPSAAAG